MKAVILRNIGDLFLSEIRAPELKGRERLLRVAACGLCRTDAKMWSKGQRDLILPRIVGHEICGIDIKSGRRAVVWPGVSCGKCENCRNGRENLCRSLEIIGFNRDGGLAEYVAVPASSLVPVPDEINSTTATLAEPFACALNAFDMLNIRKDGRLLIFGGGSLGLILAFIARMIGHAAPTVVEPDAHRLKLARKCLHGMGISIVSKSPENESFDAAINATSASEALELGIHSLKPGGVLCFFSGLGSDQKPVPSTVLNEVHYRELTVRGAYGCTRGQMRRAMSIIAEHPDFAVGMISGNLPLEKTECGFSNILDCKGLKWVVEI